MNKIKALAGVGNDLKHQAIIAMLQHVVLIKAQSFKGYKNYFAFPELHVSEKDQRVPDVVIRKSKNGNLVMEVIVEISSTSKVNDDITKVSNILNENKSIIEAFVIDKDKLEVFKITRTLRGNAVKKPSKDSKIDTLRLDIEKEVFERLRSYKWFTKLYKL